MLEKNPALLEELFVALVKRAIQALEGSVAAAQAAGKPNAG
jgi:hypothetical protein